MAIETTPEIETKTKSKKSPPRQTRKRKTAVKKTTRKRRAAIATETDEKHEAVEIAAAPPAPAPEAPAGKRRRGIKRVTRRSTPASDPVSPPADVATAPIKQAPVVDEIASETAPAVEASAGSGEGIVEQIGAVSPKPKKRQARRTSSRSTKAKPKSAREAVGEVDGNRNDLEQRTSTTSTAPVVAAATNVADVNKTDRSDTASAERRPGGRGRSRRGGRSRSSRRASGRMAESASSSELPETPTDDEAAAANEPVNAGGPTKGAIAAESRSGSSRRRRSSSSRATKTGDERKTDRAAKGKPQGRQMLINAVSGDECRIAVLFENRLEELFIERRSSVSHVGNIYKGVVTNVEPSIQAAFIDFGLAKHGFLHISDVQPQYFGQREIEPEGVGKKVPRRDRPPIQACFRRGQEVMVQITKEGVGTKGPTLTTYLSIPGRYLVMMPGMARLGVSRKIEDDDERRRMRAILNELTLPKDMGFILRTAGLDRTKRDLQRDLNYLQRLWKTVVSCVRSLSAPAELYRESDLVTRTIRDVLTTDFDRIIVDTQETADHVCEFLRLVMPRTSERIVEIFEGHDPIFHHYHVEDQIEAIHLRQVPLPSGGSIVIDSTEAMVAIDVNSGKFRSVNSEEELAYQTNLEAAEEIARQLRLRDLGGLIVCDFIDMRMDRHQRAIERILRDQLRKHKERARVLRMSKFGLIEMTRQRQGPSIKRGVYADCPHCKGSGLVKSRESMTLHVLRALRTFINREDVTRLEVTVASGVATELQNRKRGALHELEVDTGKSISINGDATYTWDQQDYKAEDRRGRIAKLNIEHS